MISFHNEMYAFYKDYVYLQQNKRDELTEFREKNLQRLKKGLQSLDYPLFIKHINQGSYAMHTMVQQSNNDYDIDVAIIFNEEDLPADAYLARKRIEEAMIEGGGNFKQPPEARTNAITVWYQEGYHVDLALHRKLLDDFGNEIIEHAGTSWSLRNPSEITEWFNNTVQDKSPGKYYGVTVPENQMRRIVQFIKVFTKSRSSWNFPGGLLISVLVDECYIADNADDSISLYHTLEKIYSRLQDSIKIFNPVDNTQELTYKSEYLNQVKRFRDQLGTSLEQLTPVVQDKSDKEEKAKLWGEFFNHVYWRELVEKIKEAKNLGTQLKNSTYVSATGDVSPNKNTETYMKPPSHKFYGE